MAVDAFLFRDADSLVLPRKSFYPVSIPVAHYQLRHYTSCSTLNANDVLFYASGPDVYALNTATRKRTHIATLPFETRCTASGHGWLCLGGEDEGHFAAIKLEGATSTAADVDTLLPIHFGSRRSARPQGPFLETIGGEIVNSISIHKLPGENGADDEAVAVLTNNDKTVRVYSLTRGKEDAVLDLPFAMNHASISPDGNIMVAVGDYHQAYFFQRIKQRHPSSGKLNPRVVSTPPGWTNICVAQLHVPPSLSTTGYFTTAWSPSGHLCAVGSECGYITVFDADLVKKCSYGEDAIVKVVRSTRPDTSSGPGAVRTMCFAPQPWDLLIWSEDQGIVCVSDLRSGLLTRQVLKLEPKEEGLDKIEAPLTDFESAMASDNESSGYNPQEMLEEIERRIRQRMAYWDDEANILSALEGGGTGPSRLSDSDDQQHRPRRPPPATAARRTTASAEDGNTSSAEENNNSSAEDSRTSSAEPSSPAAERASGLRISSSDTSNHALALEELERANYIRLRLARAEAQGERVPEHDALGRMIEEYSRRHRTLGSGTGADARSTDNSRDQAQRRRAGISDQGLSMLEDAGIYTPGYARRSRGAASSDRLDNDLTTQESSILDALTRRNRELQRIASIPRSINYPYNQPSSSDSGNRNEVSSEDFPPLASTSSGIARSTNTRHENLINELHRDLLRNSDPDPQGINPRQITNTETRNGASGNRSGSNSRLSALISTAGGSNGNTSNSSSDAWRTIEAAMSRSPAPPSSRPAGPSGQGTGTLRQPDLLLEMGRLRQLARARERIRSMQNNMQVDEYGIRVGLLRRGGTGGRYNPAFGVRTAGLAMSSDGRKLFAGTEEGIFEFEIDVRNRKAWGAVQPR
ncbi:WD40-repeat-containing domain protein [Phyllosticta citribraziliensis]